MSKSVNINREKLETALKKKFKTDRLKTISRALGFKDNALGEALRRGTISPKMCEALAYNGIGIYSDYELVSEPEEALEPLFKDNADITPVYTASEPSQMSIDDLEVIRRSELKSLIKASIIELFNVSRFEVDSLGRVTITLSADLVKSLKEQELL